MSDDETEKVVDLGAARRQAQAHALLEHAVGLVDRGEDLALRARLIRERAQADTLKGEDDPA